ncbi:alpha/beta hydrolase [Pseudonocardia ailaonensis]|uniref:alpha/beta hydrolase n=1 Tax=Pseudonocardia ailaonensis TaxID=367279 RepID=UPI0031E3DD14
MAVAGNRLAADPRVDPRIRAAFADWRIADHGNFATREEVLAAACSPEGLRATEGRAAFFERFESEAVCPSAPFAVRELEYPSAPDGNICRIRLVAPRTGGPFPCVYYVHGGGMARGSAYDGNYRLLARMIAAHGVAVAMVDFRNSVTPSSVAEVAPYPGGLHDCVSGVEWLARQAGRLGLSGDVAVAGESGGANLALATAMSLRDRGAAGRVRGVGLLAPYIRGIWPADECPSSVENNGLFLDCHTNIGVISYGVEAYEARDPLAWGIFATPADLAGLPPVHVSVNELDPYRDDGILLYRRLLEAGVEADGQVVLGTTHAVEIFPTVCPELSRRWAATVAALASGGVSSVE